MLCNSVEGNSHFQHESFFGMSFLFGVETSQARTARLISFRSCVWQDQATHQSMRKYEFDDYIFALTTEMNGKTTTELELEDEAEEDSMTVYLKTISGKTISIKCDKKQKADTVSENGMNTSIPRGITHFAHQGEVQNDKKTLEENNIGAEATIEMSLPRLSGEMEK